MDPETIQQFNTDVIGLRYQTEIQSGGDKVVSGLSNRETNNKSV